MGDKRFRYNRLEYQDEAREDLQRTSLEALTFLIQYTSAKSNAEFQHLDVEIDRELLARGRLMRFGKRD